MPSTPDHWHRVGPVALALLPLSIVYAAVTACRRALYRAGLLRTIRLPVPVIVVGNITAGGTGKTPLVLWLAASLVREGFRPGIVTRGYGAANAGPALVSPTGEPGLDGDEPVLLARRGACPVWRGTDRVAAARALLAANPDRDVIISDDGLQHYRLARDVEIALIDGASGFGNGLPIPSGPMREPVRRLARTDLLVVKGPQRAGLALPGPAAAMSLAPGRFRNLRDPALVTDAAALRDRPLHAVAGIGRPQQFFDTLAALGLRFRAHPFPDHHAYTAADFAFAGEETVVMTEKDAVKSTGFATTDFWALPVDAVLPEGFLDRVLERLRHGP